MHKKLLTMSLALLLSAGSSLAFAQTTGVDVNANVNADVNVTASPSTSPTMSPSTTPSVSPSVSPTASPSISPSVSPATSVSPTTSPGVSPTSSPTETPNTGTGSSTGSTASTTADLGVIRGQLVLLQTQFSQLQQQLSMLWDKIQALLGGNGNSNGNGTTTPVENLNVAVSPARATVMVGGIIDWNGRGFGREQDIKIMLNGQVVGNAHADGGGNFSTGSVRVPSNPGVYTYTFSGSAGDSATSEVTVI